MNRLRTSVRVAMVCLQTTFVASLWAQDEKPGFKDRFLVGLEVTANYSTEDRAYYNETEYLRNGLRLFRVNLGVEFRVAEKLSILTELRSDNLDMIEPYALYGRFRPWRERAFDLQVGRIPPVFGAFARRQYAFDNPLIGYPLAYQYPVVLRADQAPAVLQELLDQRGKGARIDYPIGVPGVMSGLPLVNPLRWDTGVQALVGESPLQLAVALTQGTLSDPQVRDDNRGKQVAARLAFTPRVGWILGVSAASGEYVSDSVTDELPPGAPDGTDQTAIGGDFELSRGAWLVRGEAIWSRWDQPTLATGPLDAFGWFVEGRYKISPGFYVAARADRLNMSEIETSGGRVSWDAPVNRIEAGFGYSLHRQVLVKFAYQYNHRDAGYKGSPSIAAVQLSVWF